MSWNDPNKRMKNSQNLLKCRERIYFSATVYCICTSVHTWFVRSREQNTSRGRKFLELSIDFLISHFLKLSIGFVKVFLKHSKATTKIYPARIFKIFLSFYRVYMTIPHFIDTGSKVLKALCTIYMRLAEIKDSMANTFCTCMDTHRIKALFDRSVLKCRWAVRALP